MRRKEVSRRLGGVAEVRASLAAHRDLVTAKLDERLAQESEVPFGYRGYFDHMNVELLRVEQGLTVAEDEHVRKLGQGIKLRRQDGELTETLYDKQTAGRQIIGGYHGQESGFEIAAVSGSTPQSSKLLSEQVDQTTKLLRNPSVEPSSGRIAGVNLDFGVMADDLETDLSSVLSVRVAYQLVRKEADGTRQIVKVAIEEYDRVFPWVASTLEGFFRLVGEHDLADRIRTSRRRVTRRQDDGDEASGSDESSADDGSSMEESTSAPVEVAEATPLSAES